MEPYRIVVTGWGVFIMIATPLASGDRASFVEQLKVTRDRVLGMEQRSVLIDLRRLPIDSDPEERVRAYVGMAQLFGAQRVAVAVPTPTAAARIHEALDAAGMGEQSRVIVPEEGDRNGLVPAIQWVDKGIDGPAP